MWQLLGSTTLILGVGCYFLYTENLAVNQKLLEEKLKVASQQEAIQELENAREEQTAALLNLQQANQEIEKDMARYLSIFTRHNLSTLAAAKPGLIETRANNATKKVFDTIEGDSRDIDGLDDGVQLATEGARGSDSNQASGDQNSTTNTPEGDRP